ncbi:MAG: 3',5'-cyclic-nucleotide phosphodiesterase [Watsoniomyces obsoletus]|nr:MAG: 3',5'-cyclic-nucleotide phosphodiesterase [Watsoniomyces obsoletus]
MAANGMNGTNGINGDHGVNGTNGTNGVNGINGVNGVNGMHHTRPPTFPLAHTSRRKPRRWPLVFRFIKGAIHTVILVPLIIHTLFSVFIVCLDQYVNTGLGLPSSIIPSLSIVVFRNQTSFNRFWTGRNYLTQICTSVRNLTRAFMCCTPPGKAERAETERVIRVLLAILYSIKNHLRAEWGAPLRPLDIPPMVPAESDPEPTSGFSDLVPNGMCTFEEYGLGLPLQLTFFVESYIKRGHEKGWFHAPQSSQLQAQLNALVDAYGKMETIKLTPLPVAHLIHQKQVLALFCCVLPLAMVDDMGWATVPIVSLITFTLYGIEGIGSQLEDPFGYDRNDIKMDGIVEDSRQEITVMLDEWKKGGEMFMTNRDIPTVTVVDE